MGRLGLLLGMAAVALGGCRPSRASQAAGQIGCKPSEITISDETVGEDGFWEGSENWVAECDGRRFICTELTHRESVGVIVGGEFQSAIAHDSHVSCKEELSSSEPASSGANSSPSGPGREPPSSGGGFDLGAKTEVAQAACEAAGHQWQMSSPSQAACSDAVASIGVPTQVSLGLCSGSVCRVTLMHAPDHDWLPVIAEVLKKLEAKYGAPGTRQATVPEDCRAGEAFVGCLKVRRARLRYAWSWGSGQSITLLVGTPLQGGAPAIRIIYAGVAAGPAGKIDESAL
jgi:hypothetical protein